MQRTISGSSNNSTTTAALPIPTTPQTSSSLSSSHHPQSSQSFHISSSSTTLADEIVKAQVQAQSPGSGSTHSSPRVELPLSLQSPLVDPHTPLNAKSIRGSVSPGSTALPTPPDSLTRMQQQQQALDGSGRPPPGLTLSPMSVSDHPISAPLSYSPRKREFSKSVQIYEDTSLMGDEESHFRDALNRDVGGGLISPLTGRVRSRTLPLEPDNDMSIRITGDLDLGRIGDHSETSSLLSPVSADSAPSSAGSATSRSPSLQTSFQQSNIVDEYGAAGAGASPSPSNRDSSSPSFPLLLDESATAAERLAKPILDATSPLSNPLMTTNVYINGLPPHFPEEELLDLVAPFGGVVSVKTFTRNNDPPSGYGFVLFDNIDSSEACVKELRKYRNLHPSFAKRTHRIPGTALEAPIFTPNFPTYPPPAGFTNPYLDTHESFNSKMERLADHGSSNLYIEGLPENADAHLLEALVAPNRVKSSRIFPSKLSNPPRMIAFIRLESREAALDTIDRLNGRLVRGYNGAEGDKILVKFADSAHQRDLRKMERLAREQRDRMRLEAQSGRETGSLGSPQYSDMGLGATSPLSPLQTFLPGPTGAAVGALSPTYSSGTPQLQAGSTTTAELERLIDILRISQLQQHQQQQAQAQLGPAVTNTLAAALLQVQLQNQASNLYDLHSRSTALPSSSLSPTSPVSPLGTQQLYNPMPISSSSHHQSHHHSMLQTNAFNGVIEQPNMQFQSYAPYNQQDVQMKSAIGPQSAIDFTGRLRPNGQSFSASSKQQTGGFPSSSGTVTTAVGGGSGQHHPTSRTIRPAGSSTTVNMASVPSNSGSTTVKATVPRYVPPPARENAQVYAQQQPQHE